MRAAASIAFRLCLTLVSSTLLQPSQCAVGDPHVARMLARISVHLQGLYGRYCAHLCQMRYASHMLWVRSCHMRASA